MNNEINQNENIVHDINNNSTIITYINNKRGKQKGFLYNETDIP